jgi:hypothetical protein
MQIIGSGDRHRIPGVVPPEILIFLHIPKTGGKTMDGVFEHCLPGQYFHAHIPQSQSALLIRPTEHVRQMFKETPPRFQRSVRCVIGEHLALDIDKIFDRPSKFFTILREPVDRVISHFFYIRQAAHLVSYPFIRHMSLEQYLDSGIGIDANDHGVRVLSGCPELDVPWDPNGRAISTSPVERRHLEMAKRNIEERFITAAPFEAFTPLVWFFKRLYGWPLHRVFFQIRNKTLNRPRIDAVPEATRRRLRQMNRYDTELYEWVKIRFAQQTSPLQPAFSREVCRFEMLNRWIRHLERLSPEGVRGIGRQVLFSGGIPPTQSGSGL